MTDHELTVFLISALATIVSGCASLLFSWIRADIRTLAEKVTSLKTAHSCLCIEVGRTNAILESKGILNGD